MTSLKTRQKHIRIATDRSMVGLRWRREQLGKSLSLPRGLKIKKGLPLSPARKLNMLVLRLEEGLPLMEPWLS